MATINLHIEIRGSEVIEVDEDLYQDALNTGCVDEFIGRYTDLDLTMAGTITEPNGSIREF